MKNIVNKIAKELNSKDVVWGIGGSYLLKRYGINTKLNEIDIVISEDSINEVTEIMNRISVKQNHPNDDKFNTKFYAVYLIEDTKINIISTLSYTSKDEFTYHFDEEDISVHETNDKVRINYCHLMDWYIIYKEINRKSISRLIEKYYIKGGFIDHTRFHKKFDFNQMNFVHRNYHNLKAMIY